MDKKKCTESLATHSLLFTTKCLQILSKILMVANGKVITTKQATVENIIRDSCVSMVTVRCDFLDDIMVSPRRAWCFKRSALNNENMAINMPGKTT